MSLIAASGFFLILLVAMALVIALVRTIATPKAPARGTSKSAAGRGPNVTKPADEVEKRLAELIRIPSISFFDASDEDEASFKAIYEVLPRLWPKVAAAVPRIEIGSRALLYEWRGSDPSLKPVILCAHFDVVPPGELSAWTHPPFSGKIAGGYVWGRGSQDIKQLLAAILEAADSLLAEDYVPIRTIYFAFGGDEEVGGRRGAGRIASLLAERGVKASFLVDEGGPVGDGLISFADRPIALIGISEKGYMDLALEAKGSGGHASMPPRRSAVGNLARAIAAIESHPAPSSLTFTVKNFLDRLAPYAPFLYRLLFRNLGLFGGLVKVAFSASPATNSLLRSSTAPTMLSGSPKENVLAQNAHAIINVRILPGESSHKVLARIEGLVGRFGVKARAASPENVVEPSPESPVDHEGWRAIEAALAVAFPQAAAVPFLFGAGTDTKHYLGLTEAVYRFSALIQTSKDLEGIHAHDERVSIENYHNCVLFYRELMGAL